MSRPTALFFYLILNQTMGALILADSITASQMDKLAAETLHTLFPRDSRRDIISGSWKKKSCDLLLL